MASFRKIPRLASFCAIAILTGCAARYKGEGIVVATNPAVREVTISHREIAGSGHRTYMPAMVMPFQVATSKTVNPLDKLAPGTRVGFVLHVTRSASWIDRLVVQKPADPGFTVPKPAGQIAVGDPVPDFTLTAQDGNQVRFADLRGRVVAINFLYTRCPLPNVCPRLAAHFGYVARQLAGQPVTLLSITLDPLYDTPEVLREYSRKFDTPNADWRFLTGTESAVHNVGNLFGMVFFPDEGAITHTSATAIIGKDGNLKALLQGSTYTAPQLRDLIAQSLK